MRKNRNKYHLNMTLRSCRNWFLTVMLLLPVFQTIAQTDGRLAGIRDLISDYKYSEAMDMCTRLLATDSSNVDLLILKGEVLTSMFRFNEAVAALGRALAIDSIRIRGLKDLASIYRQLIYSEAGGKRHPGTEQFRFCPDVLPESP
jgi:tetratricopeptide (TPR) repeat protein